MFDKKAFMLSYGLPGLVSFILFLLTLAFEKNLPDFASFKMFADSSFSCIICSTISHIVMKKEEKRQIVKGQESNILFAISTLSFSVLYVIYLNKKDLVFIVLYLIGMVLMGYGVYRQFVFEKETEFHSLSC